MQAVVREREREHRAGGLGRVAVALVVGVEDEADLALAVLADGQRDVADQLAAALDRERQADLLRPGEQALEALTRVVLAERVRVERGAPPGWSGSRAP